MRWVQGEDLGGSENKYLDQEVAQRLVLVEVVHNWVERTFFLIQLKTSITALILSYWEQVAVLAVLVCCGVVMTAALNAAACSDCLLMVLSIEAAIMLSSM